LLRSLVRPPLNGFIVMPMSEIALRQCQEEDRLFVWEVRRLALSEYVAAMWGWDEAAQREKFEQRFTPSGHQIIVADAGPAPVRAAWLCDQRRNRDALSDGEDLRGDHGITTRCRPTITSLATLGRLLAAEREVVSRSGRLTGHR
jgi:hypothetical protein